MIDLKSWSEDATAQSRAWASRASEVEKRDPLLAGLAESAAVILRQFAGRCAELKMRAETPR